jgi:DNA-binding transcriptional regulator/RsmH inhibitor MraZ
VPAARALCTEQALGAEFEKCSKRAQTRNSSRKKNSMLNLRLNDYRQVYFDREDRASLPAHVIEEIK